MSYATSVHTVFDQTLSMLDGLLAKAQEHDKGDDLLAAKLAEDMLPMATQVRYAGHQVVNTLNLLADGAYTRDEEDTDTLAQARAFIAEMRALIADHPPQSWASADTHVDYGPGDGFNFASHAHEYTRDWALPNFYFHVTTAYAILRSEGVPLGKADFLPHMFKYLRPPGE